MIRSTLFAVLLTLFAIPLQAQDNLEGLWKGTITEGGLKSNESYTFELYIQKEGKQLVGRSYIYRKDGTVIEMEVKGQLYGDLSLYLRDKEHIPILLPDGGESEAPSYTRKYQLLYKPSIWNTKLEGYWQEIIKSPMEVKRNLGRIELKKVKVRDKA